MTLLEMSVQYADSAARLRTRISELREAQKSAPSDAEVRELHARINALLPLMQEARELAAKTAHYYDKGYRAYDRDAS